ncbi:MAG: phosphomannomutase/phosphoglucomutase, partial [Gammaproteobacteria bacterium]|nr:phosphomannomutase/phosphoglucomutase [Gammaproteobacteria bacterium]
AGYLNGRINNLEQQIKTLAGSEQVIDALASNDRETLAAASHALTQLMPFARRVEIVPRGKAQIDQNAAVPISYAAMDVIRRAEVQRFVGPEGVRLEDRSYIYAASPITKQGVSDGVLFVAISPEYFLTSVAAFDPNIGRIRITQTFEGSRIDLFEWGNVSNPDTQVSIKLSNSIWTMVFEPGRAVTHSIARLTDLLTAFAVALGLMLGGVFLAFSNLGSKIQSDASALADYATRLLRGQSPIMGSYQLVSFEQLAATMSEHATARPRRPTRVRKLSTDANVEALLDEDNALEPPDDDASNNTEAEQDFLEVSADDDSDENFGVGISENVSPADLGLNLDEQIFRAYDIRGIVEKNLTADVVYWIGRAFAAEAREQRQTRVAVARDGRHSSDMLRDSLTKGLTEGGVDVLDIGCVPTPMLYFATYALDTGSGIMITGSHNPPEYNGLKMMLAGETLAEERIQSLKERLDNNRLSQGNGEVEEIDLNDHYVDRVLEDVVVAQPIKIVVDCGNGVAGVIAPRLLEEIGCEVVPLYCDVDGDFPNHHPDPADPKNLQDLITVVQAEQAQLGLAFDGDGDRLGVVTASGEIIWPDKLMMLFAKDIVSRNPGADIVYDVKCSRHLNTLISENGGRPIMWKTGHSHIKAKLKETGALLGGEFSGHIFFSERWYGFDDAIYSAARLLEIISAQNKTVDELFAQFPVTFSTPEIKIETTESEKFEIIERLENTADFGDGTLTLIDGVRVDYPDGWGLVRASNTSPVLTLRFEADSNAALDRIQDLFQEQLIAVDASLKFR